MLQHNGGVRAGTVSGVIEGAFYVQLTTWHPLLQCKNDTVTLYSKKGCACAFAMQAMIACGVIEGTFYVQMVKQLTTRHPLLITRYNINITHHML
jgi:hypothetical protein